MVLFRERNHIHSLQCIFNKFNIELGDMKLERFHTIDPNNTLTYHILYSFVNTQNYTILYVTAYKEICRQHKQSNLHPPLVKQAKQVIHCKRTSIEVLRSNFVLNSVTNIWVVTILLISLDSRSRIISVTHSNCFCVRVTHRKYTYKQI